MTFLSIILILAAIAFATGKVMGKTNVSWTIVIALAAAGFLIPLLSNLFNKMKDTSPTGTGTQTNACGCSPGQNVIVRKDKLFGSSNFVTSCAEALRLDRKKKYDIVGCA